VTVDLSGAHVWDASTVAVLDDLRRRYARSGRTLVVTGMNDDSRDRHERLAGHLGGGH